MALPDPSPKGTALVTGASSGIGAAIARELASRGHAVTLVARREERLRSLATELTAEYDADAAAVACDLGDPAERERLASLLGGTGRSVEILVNNAGFGSRGDFIANDRDRMLEMVRVNVEAVVDLTSRFLPGMVERGRGAVINVSSVASFLPGRGGTYGADKAWVTSFTEAIAGSLAGTGVRAMVLCPGFVRTEFHERAKIDVGRRAGPFWLDSARVVEECLADLARGRVVCVPSPQYKAVVAAVNVLPRPLVRRLVAYGERTRR